MNMVKQSYLYLRLYIYWHLSGSIRRYFTVISMFIKREKRLYYLYSTKELVTVTATNYLKKVKMDATEFALIETANVQGEITWSKAERF